MQSLLVFLIMILAVGYLAYRLTPIVFIVKLGNNLRKSRLPILARLGLKLMRRGCDHCK